MDIVVRMLDAALEGRFGARSVPAGKDGALINSDIRTHPYMRSVDWDRIETRVAIVRPFLLRLFSAPSYCQCRRLHASTSHGPTRPDNVTVRHSSSSRGYQGSRSVSPRLDSSSLTSRSSRRRMNARAKKGAWEASSQCVYRPHRDSRLLWTVTFSSYRILYR